MQIQEIATELHVEYRYDPESRNWSFVVPSLGIVGGAMTREQAEQQAIEAVAFTLESENEGAEPSDSAICYLHVTVQR